MTSEEWKIDYIEFLHDGQLENANKIKRSHIPNKLYRFEKVDENRLATLRNNNLYVSHTVGFDDPYDAKGYYWDETELRKFFAKEIKNLVDKYYQEIQERVKEWFESCWIGCFTEDINNFPMWYYYAAKYKGFCVEYDFSKLDEDNQFQQALKPVLYMKRKFNLTKTIETVFNPQKIMKGEMPAYYWLHSIGNIVKDESWEFEKEWRYIGFDDDYKKTGKNIKLPVKPTHIYCGKDMDKSNVDTLSEIAAELDCDCSVIAITDHSSEQFIV